VTLQTNSALQSEELKVGVKNPKSQRKPIHDKVSKLDTRKYSMREKIQFLHIFLPQPPWLREVEVLVDLLISERYRNCHTVYPYFRKVSRREIKGVHSRLWIFETQQGLRDKHVFVY